MTGDASQSRAPAHPDLIERARQLTLVDGWLRALEATAGPPAPSRVVNFHGVTGIGKSVLLRQIFAHVLGRGLPCVLLDFRAPAPGAATPPEEESLDAALAALRVSPALPALRYLPDPLIPADAPSSGTHPVRLTWQSTGLSQPQPPDRAEQRPIVLLLDHIDENTGAVAIWKAIQAEIIRPLADAQRALVVCTSQSPLYWHYYELRDICQPLPMDPFTPEETRRFLAARGRAPLTESAHALTSGHPLRLAQLVRTLEQREQPGAAPLSPAKVAATVAGLSPTARFALTYGGVLRAVDSEALQAACDTADPVWAEGRPALGEINSVVLPELLRAGLFDPYRRGQPLRFVAGVRHVLAGRLREKQPDLYGAICRRLAGLYEDRFQQRPIELRASLNEFLFFSAAVDSGAAWHERWGDRAAALLRRGQVGDSRDRTRIVVQIDRDGELVGRLDACGVLSSLRELIEELYGALGELPLLTENELVTYRQQLLDVLNSQLPLQQIDDLIDGGLRVLLNAIGRQGPTFDLGRLSIDLGKQQGAVNQAVALLHVSGLVSYEAESRRYRLTDVARSLLDDPFPSADPARVNAFAS